MIRLHRSITDRLRKVDPIKTANNAEYFIDGTRLYRAALNGIPGLIKNPRIKESIKNVDKLEREIEKLEKKIEAIEARRNKEAVKLQDFLDINLEILEEYLDPEEIKDFRN